LVDWQANTLAENIPKGNVDGAEGGAEHGAREVCVAGKHLLMVIDAARVLANEVFTQRGNVLGRRAVGLPVTCLAIADDTNVCIDADEQVAIDEEGLDL